MRKASFAIIFLSLSLLATPILAGKPGGRGPGGGDPTPALPAYGASTDNLIVAGISAGAWAAVEYATANSSKVSGVASIAGGAYYCAEGNVKRALNNCMESVEGGYTAPDGAYLAGKAQDHANAGAIDPVGNIANQRVYIITTQNDDTVNTSSVDTNADFYSNLGNNFVVYDRNTSPAGHGIMSDNYGINCLSTGAPWINNCGISTAHVSVSNLKSGVVAPANNQSGSLLRFDQNEFAPSGNAADYSMASDGFVYVPKQCSDGSAICQVVLVLHGCHQMEQELGLEFVTHSGYNEVADTNNLIVIYPQTKTNSKPFMYNPNGCFDWWGYTGTNYYSKTAPQHVMFDNMIARVAEIRIAK